MIKHGDKISVERVVGGKPYTVFYVYDGAIPPEHILKHLIDSVSHEERQTPISAYPGA
jgi:hypothetical protein